MDILFIHSSVHGHLGGFHLLAVSNHTAMIVGVQVCWNFYFQFFFFFLRIDLKEELFVHNTTLYLTFWGTARLFSTAVESRPIADRMGFPGGSVVKNSANPGDVGSIPGLGRSPGEGDGNPLQYSCLGNPMNRGAWRATVHGVPKSQRWVSD